MVESKSESEEVVLAATTALTSSEEWDRLIKEVEFIGGSKEWKIESTPNRPPIVVTLNAAMREALNVQEGEIILIRRGGESMLSVVRKAPEAMAGKTVVGISSALCSQNGAKLKFQKIKCPPEVEQRMRRVQTTAAQDAEANEFADRKQADDRFKNTGLPGVCLPKSLRVVLGSTGQELEVGKEVLINGEEHIVLPFTSKSEKWSDGIVFLTSDSKVRGDKKLLIEPIPPQEALK